MVQWFKSLKVQRFKSSNTLPRIHIPALSLLNSSTLHPPPPHPLYLFELSPLQPSSFFPSPFELLNL